MHKVERTVFDAVLSPPPCLIRVYHDFHCKRRALKFDCGCAQFGRSVSTTYRASMHMHTGGSSTALCFVAGLCKGEGTLLAEPARVHDLEACLAQLAPELAEASAALRSLVLPHLHGLAPSVAADVAVSGASDPIKTRVKAWFGLIRQKILCVPLPVMKRTVEELPCIRRCAVLEDAHPMCFLGLWRRLCSVRCSVWRRGLAR